jgi:hypothetical protein
MAFSKHHVTENADFIKFDAFYLKLALSPLILWEIIKNSLFPEKHVTSVIFQKRERSINPTHKGEPDRENVK